MASHLRQALAPNAGARQLTVHRSVVIQLKEYNPQLSSVFYNGRIPPEIRDCIFGFAMTELLVESYPTDTFYTRPNHEGRKKVSLSLLLSCKRIYAETHHLVPIQKSHVFWYYAGPKPSLDIVKYFHRFQPAQLAMVREIHLFLQQYWLHSFLLRLCRREQALLRGIQKMKITMRRGDWQNNEHNAALMLMPLDTRSDVGLMRESWLQEDKKGLPVKCMEGAWGSAFQHLESLRELEMELETYDYKNAELEQLVSHAAKWRFPMGETKVLCDDGKGVRSYEWRAPPSGWPKTCYKCRRLLGHYSPCKVCNETKELRKKGKGPLLVVKTLGWRLCTVE